MTRKNLFLALVGGILLARSAWFYRSHPINGTSKSSGLESGYVNSAICAGCHQDIAKTYRLTGMGRSFYFPSAENVIEDYKIHNTIYNRVREPRHWRLKRLISISA